MTAETTLDDPLALFAAWFDEAKGQEPNDPTAMSLATADGDGRPSVRMVLLKGFDAQGFVFYTNFESRKGEQLLANPQAALCFHWKSIRRQVRIEGPVTTVSEAEADAYYASRPRDSRVAQFAAKHAVGKVPRPPYWSGFRVAPERIEFWQDGRFRLHDRRVYYRRGEDWTNERLFP
jgi:pyridoxamine 5'-phosphate oxidase